jgi:hypothetical protein
MKKAKPQEKPQSEMSTAEKIEAWRQKRKPLTRPNGKMTGKQKREAKED